MRFVRCSVKELTAQINALVRKECEDAFSGPNAKVCWRICQLPLKAIRFSTEFRSQSTFCGCL